MHERRRPTNEDIDRIDRVIATQAEHETILWGGPNRDGIVPTVNRLAETVSALAAAVTALTARIGGEDGMAVDIKDLRREIHAVEDDLDSKHKENASRQDRQRAWLIAFSSVFGPGLLWLVYRSIVIAMQGHL